VALIRFPNSGFNNKVSYKLAYCYRVFRVHLPCFSIINRYVKNWCYSTLMIACLLPLKQTEVQPPSKESIRASSRTGSRTGSRAGSRAGSKQDVRQGGFLI
jgi:hypothetical protein